MSDIISAARLDLSLVKPYLKTFLFTMLLAGIIAFPSSSLVYGTSVAASLISMTQSYTFAIAEKNGMERLYGILPVSVPHLVAGRYLFNFLIGAAGLPLFMVLQMTASDIMGNGILHEEIIPAFAVGSLIIVVFTVIQLPGYYALGYIKGRYVLVTLVVTALLAGMLMRGSDTGRHLLAAFDKFLTELPRHPTAIVLFSAAAVLISWGISTAIAGRKSE